MNHAKLFRAAAVLLVLALSVPVAASAQAQTLPGGDWSPGAGALGDNTFQGFIDQPTSGASVAAGASFTVSGWVVDTSAQGWAGVDGVQIMLGGTMLAQAAIALPRPDVASATGNPFFAASGFHAVVSKALPGGMQTLTVVAHTPGRGSWTKQVTVNVTGGGLVTSTAAAASGLVLRIVSPTPDDLIVANNNGTITGITYDTRTRAELGIGVDRVSAYLDGPRGATGSQNLGDATFNGDTFTINWEPSRFNRVRHHILWVYARSSVTGEEVLVQQEINIASH